MTDLNELAELEAAATPGPWQWAGNTDTGEPRLTGRGCDVLAIGWDERSTTGRGAQAVREFAEDSGLDVDEEIEAWATDRYGEPIREPRLWFYRDHMADPARDHVVYEVAPDATSREDPRVYRADITDIQHPDARLITALRNAAPDLIASARRVEGLEAERDELFDTAVRLKRKYNEVRAECDAARAAIDRVRRFINGAHPLPRTSDGGTTALHFLNGVKSALDGAGDRG